MLSTFAFGALVLSVAAWKPGNNHQIALLQKPKSVSVPFREIAGNLILDVEIGTPPQKLRGLIDIEWSRMSSIPPVYCVGICQEHLFYNASASSTNIPSTQLYRDIYWPRGVSFMGQTAKDIIAIGAHAVNNTRFVTAESIDPVEASAWQKYLLWDTVVGFAPFSSSAPPRNPWDDPHSLWREMVERGQPMKENIFTLRFDAPHGGELRLGEIDTAYKDSDFTTYPLAADAITQAQWLFKSSTASLLINGHKHTISISQVRLSTAESQILLPSAIADFLMAIIGLGQVNCHVVAAFPEIHLDLGGSVLVLKGEDYVVRAKTRYWGDICFPAIGVSGSDEIVLGHFGMRGFYWVFDTEGKRVLATRADTST